MLTMRFSTLSAGAIWEVVRHDAIYDSYATWVSAGHDMLCGFSLSYQPTYFEPKEAYEILSSQASRLTSVGELEKSYSMEELKSASVKQAHSEIVNHVAKHTKEVFPELVSELTALQEQGEVFQADHYASAFIDSLLSAYNQLLFVRRSAPKPKL